MVVVAWLEKPIQCHSSNGGKVLLCGLVFRHCEKNYVVIRRSNPVKNAKISIFLLFFWIATQSTTARNDTMRE
ncbi:hypothetical protein [Rickettsia felis]|uniref:hypothetical protein n=1 Tax=Rickettsia felis TaxID=42862 RepID=UPI0009E4A5AC|nr:hypothetical protein [Rickettsia felis]